MYLHPPYQSTNTEQIIVWQKNKQGLKMAKYQERIYLNVAVTGRNLPSKASHC